MKPYRASHPPAIASLFPQWLRWRDLSDRRAALTLLFVPFFVAALVFLVAVVATLMGPTAQGSTRFYVAAITYTTLTVSFMFMPAYIVAVAWFWWKSKQDERLARLLWQIPVVVSALVWFPILILTPLGARDLAATYVILVIVSLLFGYLWVALVRYCLRHWRNV